MQNWANLQDRDFVSGTCNALYTNTNVLLGYSSKISRILTFQAPTPQSDQTHSNNSSAVLTNYLSVFDHFSGLALKGLKDGEPCQNFKGNAQFV